MATRHPRSFWKRLVSETERGGSIGPVALRHGVRPRTLMWWRWRLRHEPHSEVVTPRLLPVVVEGHGGPPLHRVEVAVGDVRLRVETGTDVAYVAALVGALRAGC
jgi:transposase-like protein